MLWNLRIQIIEFFCNTMELVGVMLVLLMAFLLQIVFNELPCPLCLLQRVGFFGVALGFLMNLRFGLRPSHYAIVILSAIFTSFVALRQIALHVVPGTGAYGDAVFGLHLYTWSFIVAMIILIVTTLLFSIDRQYQHATIRTKTRFFWLTNTLFAATFILISLNLLFVIKECGFKACPENPTTYLL